MCGIQVITCLCGRVEENVFAQCERDDFEEGQIHPIFRILTQIRSCETCRFDRWSNSERQRLEVEGRRLGYVASKAYAARARGEILQPGTEWYEVLEGVDKHILAVVETHYSNDFDAGKRLHPYWIGSPSLVELRKEFLWTPQSADLEKCIRRQAEIDTGQREMTEEDKLYSLTAILSVQQMEWNDGGETVSFGTFLKLFPLNQRQHHYGPLVHGLDLIEDIHAYMQYLKWCFDGQQREDDGDISERFQSFAFTLYWDLIDPEINQLDAEAGRQPLVFRLAPFKPGMPVPQTLSDWAAPRSEAINEQLDCQEGWALEETALIWYKLVVDYRLYLLDTACDISISSFDAMIETITLVGRKSLIASCEPDRVPVLHVVNPDISDVHMRGGDGEDAGDTLSSVAYVQERGRLLSSPEPDEYVDDDPMVGVQLVFSDVQVEHIGDPGAFQATRELRSPSPEPSEEGEIRD